MNYTQYEKLQEELNAVLIAHKLVGTLNLQDSYFIYHDCAYEGEKGFNLFVDDFKWSLSDNPIDSPKLVLTASLPNTNSYLKVIKFLINKKVKFDITHKNKSKVFKIFIKNLGDNEISSMAELTDFYLTLKNSLQNN